MFRNVFLLQPQVMQCILKIVWIVVAAIYWVPLTKSLIYVIYIIESSWQYFISCISQLRLREVKTFTDSINVRAGIQTHVYMTLKFMLFPIHHSAGDKYCPNSIYEEVILKCYFSNCYINTYKSSSWPKMVNCPFTTKSSNSTTNWSLVWDSVLANRFPQLTPEDCQ